MPDLKNRFSLLTLAAAAALEIAARPPALALVLTSEVGVNDVVEFDSANDILHSSHVDTTSGGPANARVQLGNGTNAFAQPAFTQAFSTFHNTRATYWVNLNADNTTSFADSGIGAARVHLTYTAIKEHGDGDFILHTTGGELKLGDPDAGRIPLSARVELDASVLSGTHVLSRVFAHAELFGNGGPIDSRVDNFQLLSNGFDIQIGDFIINLDSAGAAKNEVGAELRLRPLNIPLNLANIVDGTPITIDVTLNGEVRARGAETLASAFFRDPTHINDPDPLAGASTATFHAARVVTPAPATLALLGPALLGAWGWTRRRRDPPAA